MPVCICVRRLGRSGRAGLHVRLVGLDRGPGDGLAAMIDHEPAEGHAVFQPDGIDQFRIVGIALRQGQAGRSNAGIAFLRYRESQLERLAVDRRRGMSRRR